MASVLDVLVAADEDGHVRVVDDVVGHGAQQSSAELGEPAGTRDDVGGSHGVGVADNTVTRVLVLQSHELSGHLNTHTHTTHTHTESHTHIHTHARARATHTHTQNG